MVRAESAGAASSGRLPCRYHVVTAGGGVLPTSKSALTVAALFKASRRDRHHERDVTWAGKACGPVPTVFEAGATFVRRETERYVQAAGDFRCARCPCSDVVEGTDAVRISALTASGRRSTRPSRPR